MMRRYEFYHQVKWQEQYPTSERSERVKYCCSPREHKIHILELTCRHTDDSIFDDFPTISDHFPKISEAFPKLFRRLYEAFPNFSENFRRLPKTFEVHPKMFRSFTNELKYNLRGLDRLKVIKKFV